jgi:hypothetical protein
VEPTWGPGRCRGSEELREPGSRGRPGGVPKNLGGHAQRSEEPGRRGRGLRRAGATGSLEGSADPKRGGPGSAMRGPCHAGRGLDGSEEPTGPDLVGKREGGAPKSSVTGSRRGVATRVWVVPAGPGQSVGAPKSLGGGARVNRGPNPTIGYGVRGGDSDAVMLRSAEADPHITEHPLGRTPRRPKQRGGNRPEVPGPKLRSRERAIESPPGTGSFPGVAARHRLEPPEGGPGWFRGRGRGRPARAVVPPRWGGAGLVGISRSSRLQGVAPLTNPLRHVAVASDLALVSSMGFVVPFKVPCVPHHPGDAKTGWLVASEPEFGDGGPRAPLAAARGVDGIPRVVHALARCRSGCETAAGGGNAESHAAPFQRGGGTLESLPGHACGRSRGGGPGKCHRSLSGVHGGC